MAVSIVFATESQISKFLFSLHLSERKQKFNFNWIVNFNYGVNTKKIDKILNKNPGQETLLIYL